MSTNFFEYCKSCFNVIFLWEYERKIEPGEKICLFLSTLALPRTFEAMKTLQSLEVSKQVIR